MMMRGFEYVDLDNVIKNLDKISLPIRPTG